MNTAAIMRKMIEFYRGSLHDIEHFLKVREYAVTIGALEGLNEQEMLTLDIAAITHDIACPLCRGKYGSAPGNRQEEESEALLRPFLAEFDLPEDILERVIYLVTHHHTTSNVAGKDYRILLEADFLVNASEQQLSRETIEIFYDRVAETAAGKALMKNIFLR